MGTLPPDHFDPIVALPFCLTKDENPAVSLCKNALPFHMGNQLPLHGKAATGGFFAYFES